MYFRKLTPIGDRVLLKKPSMTKSVGGIHLPESAQIKHNWGTVVDMGPGKYVNGILRPMVVKRGDKVLMGDTWGGKEIKIDGQEHVIVKEDDILGFVEVDEKQSP